MRLVSFLAAADVTGPDAGAPAVGPSSAPAGRRTGLLLGDEVVDLTDAAVGLPADMTALLEGGEAAMARVAAAATGPGRRLALDGVRLLAPVPVPPTVLAIGMNYAAHVAEFGRTPPEHQVWFNKQRTCVVGPGAAVEVPAVSDQVDYEGELALVIGRRCRHVPAADALSVVAGFSVMNDVSVRDWQWRTPTWTLGKSFDTHGPLGPCLVTPDELGDPGDLGLRTWVNGELRQDASTADMLFDCAAQIELLSTVCTLEPGTVLSTGTPPGVGAAFDPPRWLVPGDVVRVEVDGLGVLENPIVATGRS